MDHVIEQPIEETVDKGKETDGSQKSIEIYTFAGFWIRFFAYLADWIVLGSLYRILLYPLFRGMDFFFIETNLFSNSTFHTICKFLLMYGYFILMTKQWGQTLGKMIFGLKVVHETGVPLSWKDVFFRELIGKFISRKVFYLGYLTVAFTAKKKGWHDYIADTVVIREKKGIIFHSSDHNEK